eukprot:7380651-Prymnesium_polylepis.2
MLLFLCCCLVGDWYAVDWARFRVINTYSCTNIDYDYCTIVRQISHMTLTERRQVVANVEACVCAGWPEAVGEGMAT